MIYVGYMILFYEIDFYENVRYIIELYVYE